MSNTENKTRSPLSRRLRFDVFKRDGFRCVYCGAEPTKALLQCDHIHPVSQGGTDEIDNLVTSCQPCNIGKSARLLSDVPVSLTDRAADVAEQEDQIAEYETVMHARRARIEAFAEHVMGYFCDTYFRDGVPMNDFRSMKRFVERLGLDAVIWSAERAAQQYPRSYRKAFLYFCGICWRKIREAEAQ